MEVLTPRPTSEGQKTLFVTFYSFKGGVGRTLALLNTACILAGLGRRVLMVDFDLEAPGLTLFQDKQREDELSRQKPGLVDAIDDFLEDPWNSPIGDGAPDDFFDTYVSSLDVPEGVQKGDKDGTLDLVPAGRLDDEYETLLYDLDFEKMFEEGVGRPFFERLKDLIEDSGRYDYILVDSRTGFSDEGSICTRVLGDYLLVLTGLNRQNVRGTARFLDRSNVAEREETLALVASPVPMYYEKLRAERIEAAKKHITERAGLDEVRFVTQIPYHPVLALEEDPTVRSLEGTDLFESYEDITERLRTWAGDRPEEQIERVFDLLREGETNDALEIFRNVRSEDPKVALQFLRNTGQVLVREHPETAPDFLSEGITIAQDLADLKAEGTLLTFLADAYENREELENAVQCHKEALRVSRDLNDANAIATDLFNLGNLYRDHGDTSQAIEYYKQARERFQESGNQSGEARTLVNLGNGYAEEGDLDSSIKVLERSYNIAQELDDRRSEAGALANLGNRYAEQGDLEKAVEYYQQSQKLFEDMEDYLNQARVLENLGIRTSKQEEYDRALEYFRHAVDIYREIDEKVAQAKVLDKLGALHFKKGDLKHSIKSYKQALNLQKEAGNQSGELSAIRSLAGQYTDIGQIEQAIELLKRGYEISEEVEAESIKVDLLNNLGYCYLEKGNLSDAIECLREASKLSREIDDEVTEGIALLNLGVCHVQSDDSEEALAKLERASNIIDSLEQPILEAALQFSRVRILSHIDPERALDILLNNWTLIQQEYSSQIEKMKSHILRARLRLEVEDDAEGAADDAQKALDFYREHDIDSRWSREAEEILEKAQSRIE